MSLLAPTPGWLPGSDIALDGAAPGHLMRQFAENVRRYPLREAVKYRDETLNYAQLDRAANRLATYLRDRGIGEGSPTGVYLRPCVDSIVALLAIMKRRAIYVPLDPDIPLARLNTILSDVRPELILTDADLGARLLPAGDREAASANAAAHEAAPVFENTVVNLAALQLPDEDECESPADNPPAPAYIFYTSGTTGKPKGVVGTQQTLSFYINSALTQFHHDFTIVMPAIARFTFSISLFELLCPLIAGGTLLLLDREHVLDAPRLARTLESVTMLHMGPSLFKSMVAYLQGGYVDERGADYSPFDGLRHVSLGGDIVPPSLLKRLPGIFRNAELFVIYGCSEIACMGCNYPVDTASAFERPLVGAPFPAVGLRLLDELQQPVALGEVGEIYFSGPGLTAGYLNLDALTAQKYIEFDGVRCYRTGDLGRLDESGNLEVMGRSDFQVKIRGIRIELGEIEAHLTAFSGVSDALVVAVPTESDERALCAYLVGRQSEPLEMAAIKAHLVANLPDYMVPIYYMQLQKLPLNHNLKLDRSALPMPTREHLVNTAAYEAPQSMLESVLVEIWGRILKIDGIGVTHSFFDLGGDSLLAARFIVEVDKQLSQKLPISTLFVTPTIRGIAGYLADTDRDDTAVPDSFLFRKGSGRMLFMLHGALVYRQLADAIDNDIGCCAVFVDEEAKLIGAKSTEEFFSLYESVESMAQRYLLEIKRLQPTGPYHLAGFSMGGLVTMEVAQRLVAAGDEVADLFLFDCYLPEFFGKFYWDKVFTNLRKMVRRGLPHLKYMIGQLGARLTERQFLREISAKEKTLTLDDLEELRYLARRHASDDYRPRRFDGRVVLFRALRRPDIGYVPKDRTLGWHRYLRRLAVHDVDDEHLEMLTGNEVHRIAKIISAQISTPESAALPISSFIDTSTLCQIRAPS